LPCLRNFQVHGGILFGEVICIICCCYPPIEQLDLIVLQSASSEDFFAEFCIVTEAQEHKSKSCLTECDGGELIFGWRFSNALATQSATDTECVCAAM
jgi:hypothetical protein